MKNLLKQIFRVSAMNLASVPQRLDSSCVVVIGIAGAVGVLISALSLGTNLSETIRSTGRLDRAIVLRSGSTAEVSSMLPADAIPSIMEAAGIARNADGDALATADMVTVVKVANRKDGSKVNLSVRGMGRQAFAVRPEIKLLAGRIYQPGLREVIVGRSAHAQFRGLEIGAQVPLRNSKWTVVGIYASGNALESALLTDANTLLADYQLNGGNSVTVMLESEDAFAVFSDAVSANTTLPLDAIRERDYYEVRSDGLSASLFMVTYFVGGIMTLGALLAALNTMYAAVSVRTSEIATLRAIGFGSGCVIASVLVESLLLAILGASLGAGAAWWLFGGNFVYMSNAVSTSTLIFKMEVTPDLLVIGAVLACAIGLIGGLLPAIRAARMPVADALRAV
jgi:putative ABC transport system permease protein